MTPGLAWCMTIGCCDQLKMTRLTPNRPAHCQSDYWAVGRQRPQVRPKGTLKPNEDGGGGAAIPLTSVGVALLTEGYRRIPKRLGMKQPFAKNAEQEVFVEPTPIFARGPASCAETWATKAMWAPSLRARNQVYHSNQFVGSQNNLMSDANCKMVKLNSTFNFAV